MKDNIEQRKRYFSRHNKDDVWRRMKKNNEKDVKEEKRKYLQKIGEKLKEEGSSNLP